MAYITEALLEQMIGADKLAGLVESPSVMSQSIVSATAQVEGALASAGYSQCVPSTVYLADASDCPALIREIAATAFRWIVYSRHDLGEVPDDLREAWPQLVDLINGRVEIPGVSRSVSRSVGGITYSSSVTRPQVFSRALGTR